MFPLAAFQAVASGAVETLVGFLRALSESGAAGLAAMLCIVLVGSFVWVLHRILRFLTEQGVRHEQMAAQCHQSHAQNTERCVAALDRSTQALEANARQNGEISTRLQECAQSHRDLERTMRERATQAPVQQVTVQPGEQGA